MSDKNTHQSAASLREAAQNALVTLDGIASANPRDTADFETPAEWIAWAKSRARWAADALRTPVAQEIYAERVLKNMLQEADRRSAFDTLPDDYEAPHLGLTPKVTGGAAVRVDRRLGVTSEDDNMDNPQERAKRLATNAAEEFVRCNGIPTGAPDQFVFHGADLADEYFQDCIAHLKLAGECVVFEHDEETTVLLGDYTLGSFE